LNLIWVATYYYYYFIMFTDQELQTLNNFLNGQDSLPVDVAALNGKLREHFEEDMQTPEVDVTPEVTEDPADEAVETSEETTNQTA
jgi:hypothetical protein